MFKINFKKTCNNAKKHLDMITRIIHSGCYDVKIVDLTDIDDHTNLQDLIQIKTKNCYDEMILHDLEIMSRLDIQSKQILYCVHLLDIKRKNLSIELNNKYNYSFGDPFYSYAKALENYSLTQIQFIEYED